MTRIILTTIALAFAIVGCNVSTDGQNRLVRFQFDDPTAAIGASLDRPIAVGTVATVDIQAINAVDGIRVRGAKVEPEGLARVTGVDNATNKIQIEGLMAGEGQLIIETDKGQDIGTIYIAEAAKTQLYAPQDLDLVLAGGIETFVIERLDAVGQRMVGIAAAEMEVSPAEAAERVGDGEAHEFRLRYLVEGGQVIEVGDGQVSRQVVGANAVSMFVFGEALEGNTMKVDETQGALIQLADASGEMIGALEGAINIASQTPEVCEASYRNQALYLSSVEVTGLAAGECVITGAIGDKTAELRLNIAN